jgi:hypothetical protein
MIRRPQYPSLAALLARELVEEDDPATAGLVRRLAPVRRRGWFTRGEFLAMCRWKSPRALHHCRRNTPARIRAMSRALLSTRDEGRRLTLLTGLQGVSVPTASAILTLVDPRRYGVLDIRVWQLLYAMGVVDHRPRGVGFTGEDWLTYLVTLRRAAREAGAPVRRVEYSLFLCHRRRQRGLLYESRRGPRGAGREQRSAGGP